MTVKRLRPLPSADQLAVMYATPHDHRIYGRGHHERVEATIALAREHIAIDDRYVCADLSCGNGHIARQLGVDLHLGDIAGAEIRSSETGYLGPLEETLELLPTVGTYVCSETIEHLDDPAVVLSLIRSKAVCLVLSTPLDCWDDTNGEHLHAWDREGVEDLLRRAGWTVTAFDSVDSRVYFEPYLYGLWVCR